MMLFDPSVSSFACIDLGTKTRWQFFASFWKILCSCLRFSTSVNISERFSASSQDARDEYLKWFLQVSRLCAWLACGFTITPMTSALALCGYMRAAVTYTLWILVRRSWISSIFCQKPGIDAYLPQGSTLVLSVATPCHRTCNSRCALCSSFTYISWSGIAPIQQYSKTGRQQ